MQTPLPPAQVQAYADTNGVPPPPPGEAVARTGVTPPVLDLSQVPVCMFRADQLAAIVADWVKQLEAASQFLPDTNGPLNLLIADMQRIHRVLQP